MYNKCPTKDICLIILHFSDMDAHSLSTKGTTVLRILVTALGNVLEKRTGFNEDFKIAIFKKAGIAKRPNQGVRKAVCNYGIVFCTVKTRLSPRGLMCQESFLGWGLFEGGPTRIVYRKSQAVLQGLWANFQFTDH